MLSEISHIEKDKCSMISLICGNLTNKNNDLIDTESKLVDGGWVKCVNVVKRSKLPVTR